VDASFVARALDVQDRFPQVTDCRFECRGGARRREIFAARRRDGDGVLLPGGRIVEGSEFGAFTHIMGNGYPAANLRDFNHRFAPPERLNRFGPFSPEDSGTRGAGAGDAPTP
jgi:hypothetical protein